MRRWEASDPGTPVLTKGVCSDMITEKLLRFLKENWVSLLIVVGLPLAWFVLRSEGTALASVDAFE